MPQRRGTLRPRLCVLGAANFGAAFKEKIGGEEAYEIRGKEKSGKNREVEVSADSKLLGTE
jgi:hypothetical protein